MSARFLDFETTARESTSAGLDWQAIYRAGAGAALLIVLTGLLDIAIMFLPGTGTNPGERTVLDWFNLLQSEWFLALRDLGLLNMITMTCSLLTFCALFGMLRRTNPLGAALGLVLACLGAAIYIANNVGLPMLTLSQRYAAADSASQRALWAGAGQALLAREDLSAGAFPGFFFAEAAGLWMAGVALRGRIFRPWEAGLGMAATGCLVIFNACAAFIPAWYDSVMPVFGAGGGLLSLAWYGLIAARLLRAREVSRA